MPPKKDEITTLGIKQLDPNQIKNTSTVLIIGKRNSGKSVFLKDLLYHKQDIPSGIVFSGTESSNGFFSKFIPDCFVHNEYKPSIITKLIARQQRKMFEKTEKKQQAILDPVFVVLDDLNYNSKEWKNEQTMKYLFMNGRHDFIFLVITLQYMMSITPEIRQNADYVIIFAQSSAKAKKSIYEEFGGCCGSYETFNYIYDSCTKNHCCLVIKTTGNGISDQVFWYKADIKLDFKMGDPSIWKYHSKQYNQNYRRDAFQKKINQFEDITKVKVTVNKLGNVTQYKT